MLTDQILAETNGSRNSNGSISIPCVCKNHKKNNPLQISDIFVGGQPDISVFCHAGCDFKDVRDKLKSLGWIPDNFKNKGKTMKDDKTEDISFFNGINTDQPETEEQVENPVKSNVVPMVKKKVGNHFIWNRAKADNAGVINKVLSHRGLKIDNLNEFNCRVYSYDGNDMLVFPMVKPNDPHVFGINRMFYSTDDYKKIDCKMLGVKERGGCKERAVHFYPKRKDNETFIVGEGIETVLSVVQTTGMNGAACCSSSNLAKFQPFTATKTLYIAVDSDKGFAGQKAGLSLAKRLEKKGIKCLFVTPDDSCFTNNPVKKDFNDLLLEDLSGESILDRFEKELSLEDLKDFKIPKQRIKEKSEDNNSNTNNHLMEGEIEYPPAALKALKNINKKNHQISFSGKFRVLTETDDNSGNPFEFSRKRDFIDLNSREKIVVNTRRGSCLRSIGAVWAEWEGANYYKGLSFEPDNSKLPEKYFNLFRGLIAPQKGDCSKFLDHTLNVICNGDKKYYKYLISWMARAVQKPGGGKIGTAIVLQGKKGCGKGAFVDYYSEIFGESAGTYDNPDDLFGSFNFHLAHKLLLFLDEAIWGGKAQDDSSLKRLITGHSRKYTSKGIDGQELPSYFNLILASNNDWVVPASEDERRYFVLKVPDTYIKRSPKTKKYFDDLWFERENGGVAALMDYLLKFDYSEVDLRDAPVTEALSEQIELALPRVHEFWKGVLDTGVLLTDKDSGKPYLSLCGRPAECKGGFIDSAGEPIQMFPKEAWKYEIYNEFINFCKQKNERYPETSSLFWKKLKEFFKGGVIPRKRKRTESGQKDYIELQPIEDMKVIFTNKTTIKFDD